MYFEFAVLFYITFTLRKNDRNMKKRILFLIAVYFWFFIMFVLQKPLFMLFHWDIYGKIPLMEWFSVMWNGRPLDFSMAAYLTAIPALFVVATVYLQKKWWIPVYRVYFAIVSFVVAAITLGDAVLYSYWGFRIDATPLFYLTSPADAVASIPAWETVLIVFLIFVYAALLLWPMWRLSGKTGSWQRPKKSILSFACLLLLAASLFIPIRGGFTVSTMNVGKVYFSDRMALNHAAINPVFSLMSSLSKSEDFSSQYRFFEPEKADVIFEPLRGGGPSVYPADSLQWVKARPNVLLIVLESFSGVAMESLGGIPGVMPNLEKIASEGILFTNFYANSFRTDRGLTSILSGYPAQPTASIMKYPAKSQSLPGISKSLRKAGYDTQFLYGGDADFTNMRSYFISMGMDNIVCDRDFPLSQRLSKWGVPDDVTFKKFYSLIKEQSREPFMKMFLTLSSHEPFDVPMNRLEDKYLNSIAYTDSCVGDFVEKLKRLPVWDNTLIVFVADHAKRYPQNVENHDIVRHHIPMVWAGGAVKRPLVVDEYLSQMDLAATLLAQLHIPYDDFTFSKNLTDSTKEHFVFYAFPDGVGFVDKDGAAVYDCASQSILIGQNDSNAIHLNKGKAYLQKLYDDLARR